MKPFSQACENNKRPILEVLRRHLADVHELLEIGSGTGQHAVFFAAELPHLVWQPSDRRENHDGILAWIRESGRDNVRPPLELDVSDEPWPITSTAAVFSANTCHIMSWEEVVDFFTGVGRILKPGGRFCLYGPFNYGGRYTSESNAVFDQMLRRRDPLSGIRNLEDLDDQAARAGLHQIEDNEMPANNRLLVWRK